MSESVVYVLPHLKLRTLPLLRPCVPHRGDVVRFGPGELPARVAERWLFDAGAAWEVYLTPLDGTPEQWRQAGFAPPPKPDDSPPPF